MPTIEERNRTVLTLLPFRRLGFEYKRVKVSSYIAQYPVLRTIQTALHFTSLVALLIKPLSELL